MDFDLRVDSRNLLLLLQLIQINRGFIYIAYIIIGDVIGAEVTEVVLIDLIYDVFQQLSLDFLSRRLELSGTTLNAAEILILGLFISESVELKHHLCSDLLLMF